MDDPTLVLTEEYIMHPTNHINPFVDPHYLFGPSEWRTEHSQELERAYSESHSLRRVRVLDWLPIQHARVVPRFEVGDITVMYCIGSKLTTNSNNDRMATP